MSLIKGVIVIRFRSLFFGKRLTLIFFLVSVFFLSAYSACFAQDPGDQTVVSKTVTIKSKGDGGIVIGGQHYRVGKSTTILDVDGNSISLCDLLVPCEAVVEYRLMENQESVCLRIKTKRVLDGAVRVGRVDDRG